MHHTNCVLCRIYELWTSGISEPYCHWHTVWTTRDSGFASRDGQVTFSSPHHLYRYWGTTASYPVGTRGPFLRVKFVKLTTPTCPVLRRRMRGAIPPLSTSWSGVQLSILWVYLFCQTGPLQFKNLKSCSIKFITKKLPLPAINLHNFCLQVHSL
jgi:hypothetical protein